MWGTRSSCWEQLGVVAYTSVITDLLLWNEGERDVIFMLLLLQIATHLALNTYLLSHDLHESEVCAQCGLGVCVLRGHKAGIQC